VARDLVAALKFRSLLPAARAAAELIAERSPSELLSGRPLVPVPPAALRHAWRGFDPAAELATALVQITGASLSPCLRRRGSGPQRGRGRRERLTNAPQIEAAGDVPGQVLLIDDVLTTGATLAACAAALRTAGGVDVKAICFTHEL
jgi:predicted amidophosphoribosyltransferase